MATDGVKIIDGDTAHDTYSGIMDLYDSGATIETIKSTFPFPLDQFDDFEYEVYTTAYALAMWEIGYLKEDVLREVKNVIDKGACVKVWTEECDQKTGNKRQQDLDKLWNKITSANSKIRKRKKYKSITNFLFEINEVLTFQLPDNNYYATIILSTHLYKRYCIYGFGQILYKNNKPPTLSEIIDCEIIGRKIPTGQGIDMPKIISMGMEEIVKQGGLQLIMEKEADRTGNYIIGLSKMGIEHNDLIKIANKFTRIGKINLKDLGQAVGSYGVTHNFEGLTRAFNDLENHINEFRESKFKIKGLVER